MKVKVVRKEIVPQKRYTKFAEVLEAFLALGENQALFVTETKPSALYSATYPHPVTVRKGIVDGEEGYFVVRKEPKEANNG